MKALRYLLMMIAVMGVLSVSAQTPKYGKPYKPYEQTVSGQAQMNAQMPEATIGSTGSAYMMSGSTLPMAAQDGVTTCDESTQSSESPKGTIRRSRPGDNEDPYKDPLGDAGWPLAMCAVAYLIIRVARRRALND